MFTLKLGTANGTWEPWRWTNEKATLTATQGSTSSRPWLQLPDPMAPTYKSGLECLLDCTVSSICTRSAYFSLLTYLLYANQSTEHCSAKTEENRKIARKIEKRRKRKVMFTHRHSIHVTVPLGSGMSALQGNLDMQDTYHIDILLSLIHI